MTAMLFRNNSVLGQFHSLIMVAALSEPNQKIVLPLKHVISTGLTYNAIRNYISFVLKYSQNIEYFFWILFHNNINCTTVWTNLTKIYKIFLLLANFQNFPQCSKFLLKNHTENKQKMDFILSGNRKIQLAIFFIFVAFEIYHSLKRWSSSYKKSSINQTSRINDFHFLFERKECWGYIRDDSKKTFVQRKCSFFEIKINFEIVCFPIQFRIQIIIQFCKRINNCE